MKFYNVKYIVINYLMINIIEQINTYNTESNFELNPEPNTKSIQTIIHEIEDIYDSQYHFAPKYDGLRMNLYFQVLDNKDQVLEYMVNNWRKWQTLDISHITQVTSKTVLKDMRDLVRDTIFECFFNIGNELEESVIMETLRLTLPENFDDLIFKKTAKPSPYGFI